MTTNCIRRIASLPVLIAAMILTGCELTSTDDEVVRGGTVVVANQGNFSDGNGSITVYEPSTMTTAAVATGLASIVQSVHVADGLLFVAANTGGRIDVYGAFDGLQVGQIDNVASPRYMDRVSASMMVVTNLFDNTLSFVDVDSSRVIGSTPVGANPEGVLVHRGMAYVANHGFGSGTTVSVVDLETRALARTIDVNCDGPRFLFVDSQNELLVVCSGQTLFDADFNVIGTTDGAVLVLDPGTGNERVKIDVDGMILTAGPGQDAYYAEQIARLFVVKDQTSILIIDTDLNMRIAEIDLSGGDAIGAVAYDHVSDRLYVARVPGFTEAGQVEIMTLQGAVLSRFDAGVAPSHIAFVRE